MEIICWLVEFHTGPAVIDGKAQKPVETKEIRRAYAPTRWARTHLIGLRRARQGAEVTYSITRMS